MNHQSFHPSSPHLSENFIGVMSGTSMDGIDAVCVNYINEKFNYVIGHDSLEYPNIFKQSLLSLQNLQDNEIHQCQILSLQLTEYYINLVNNLLSKFQLKNSDITAIGCHGQTIRHCPEHYYSIQLANYSLLAEKTKIKVVGDFRSTDLAAGGQGAPLVPAFHQELFSSNVTRVILNLGGIANISILKPQYPIIGFDTGPGNMLIDACCRLYFDDIPYDQNGVFSQQGKVIKTLLNSLLATPYFYQKPPKSTGRDLFSFEWLKDFLKANENPFDIIRTLVELTAVTITQDIKRYAPETKEIYICGGGIYNTTLITRLKELLNPISLNSTELLGMHPMHVEASAFSWLAMKRIHKKFGNIPSSTGAQGYRILGALWEPFI